MSDQQGDTPLKHTPLYDFHNKLDAKMVPFAGYEMPLQYPLGVLKEHLHVREKAGLFDVSHMGQAFLIPADGEFKTAAHALETLAPGNFVALKAGRQRYSQLLNDEGGVLDDLMVTRLGMEGHEHWVYVVVNAACKTRDFALIEKSMPDNVEMKILDDMALVALQGPKAVDVLAGFAPQVADMAFMSSLDLPVVVDGNEMWMHVSRSGYTGEDGFELAIKSKDVETFWRALEAHPDVEAIGLGARDSLRLEAGLCLYGHDIDETTTPIESNLTWSIGKRRRENGGFPGADKIFAQLKDGPARKLVGIRPEGRAPAREGTKVFSTDGAETGIITSGGYGPSVGGPVAMGYVSTQHSEAGTMLELEVRGKRLSALVQPLPFVAHNFYRKKK
ncbi:MAG: glycine cleavage system aminomethyltransferase GcvT [bacterium]|nr:glycine cleavage system aminomethyltransferase GcvT [bacterium]